MVVTNDVYLMKPEDVDTFSESAALAFEDYPLFRYFVGTPYDYNAAKTILSASIKAMDRQAIGIASGKDGAALAVFVHPDYNGTPTLPFLSSGGIKLSFMQSPAIFIRLSNYENYAMRLKKKYADNNCWYLYNLTVSPEYQHKGLASKVLRPMLDFLDATGQSCYLETNKDINVPLYEHFGFALMETGVIPGTDISHYAMLRPPRKATKEQ